MAAAYRLGGVYGCDKKSCVCESA